MKRRNIGGYGGPGFFVSALVQFPFLKLREWDWDLGLTINIQVQSVSEDQIEIVCVSDLLLLVP